MRTRGGGGRGPSDVEKNVQGLVSAVVAAGGCPFLPDLRDETPTGLVVTHEAPPGARPVDVVEFAAAAGPARFRLFPTLIPLVLTVLQVPHAGLNKGEARHTLARAVFAPSQGRVHDRSHDAQQKRVMALNLVIPAIVYWNTSYIDKAVNHLRRERRLANPNLLRHVSPLGWEHIVLTGDYDWNSGAAERTNARPLNLHSARTRAGGLTSSAALSVILRTNLAMTPSSSPSRVPGIDVGKSSDRFLSCLKRSDRLFYAEAGK